MLSDYLSPPTYNTDFSNYCGSLHLISVFSFCEYIHLIRQKHSANQANANKENSDLITGSRNLTCAIDLGPQTYSYSSCSEVPINMVDLKGQQDYRSFILNNTAKPR